jgi:hypothetical protein
VLAALGFPPDRRELPLERGGEELAVPVAASRQTHTGLRVVGLDLRALAVDVDKALDPQEAGRLLAPLQVGGHAVDVEVADAVAQLFAADEPPRYALLVAGGIVVLADRAKWAEGRFLAVDLDLALSRGDPHELETVAALFSADALAPADDGQALLEVLAERSQKHAVGVSKELREGVRRSVEILANEVIQQRLAAKLRVYEEPGLAGELTRQCLRFLYRLLFLLYAEARPELEILPLDYDEYQDGYGLDRLRELALVNLTDDRARNGHHLHESLKLLFRLVNEGYHERGAQAVLGAADGSEGEGLRFEPLHSELFSPGATALLDQVPLRNEALQQVLRLLLLSREQRGRERGYVSYAQLGINQLGAVYEGLMAYTGFFADEDLFEVARPGQEDRGVWVVPARLADQYADEWFVKRTDPETGLAERVKHPKGSFVFRLSGRERQRTASYYTPEVLTRCVVKHALAELLDQDGQTTPASRLLELTVCEPALGSGAFLNEAINQLADEYLRRRQLELGREIPPERYLEERQKVKAHIALHQCYGVDLNATALELAEVSLWLNAVYKGLQAPWFGLHLRRGNSLVGACRATYRRDQLARGAWLKAAPRDRKLADGPLDADEIHHFLLPAAGWGAVAAAPQARELRPERVEALKAWRRAVTRPPSAGDASRLLALASRVEDLWRRALANLLAAERGLRRRIAVWGADLSTGEPETREQVEAVLRDPDSALGRLRLVMDAWCALWFWPVDGPEPPSWSQWLDALEALLGHAPAGERVGQLNMFEGLADLDAQDRQARRHYRMRDVAEVLAAHPWLEEVQRIREREGFFHWELEFAPVFAQGGFDLQVGNPPWVRPVWEDDLILAEFDPWFGLEKPPVPIFSARRKEVLKEPKNAAAYLEEVASGTGLNEILGSPTTRPLLAGIQTNLYMVFMDTVWRHAAPRGIASLVHPESHFTDPKGGQLRRATYRHLRRHFQFMNELFLFEDINHKTIFGIHVYGHERRPRFLQLSYLQHPDIVDGSLEHDGSGELPGIQYPQGGWDLRPHKARVLTIDEQVLASWARLFDEPGTPPAEARLLRPITTADLKALEVIASQPVRLADHNYHWTRCFDEDKAKKEGVIRWETRIPRSWDEVILQGPHFSLATPFAKQPNEHCRHNQDYTAWNLERLPEQVIPRTNYQRACDRETYEAAISHWAGKPSSGYWRLFWRRMTQPGLERSLQPALIPPGPTHVHTVHSLSGSSAGMTAKLAGLWATLPFDYLVKVSGKSDIQDELVRQFPAPQGSPYLTPLLLRTLRLNCLTREYAPLWEELYDPAWRRDRWTDPDSTRPPLGDIGPEWTMATPLRTDYDRRMALVELDALAALILGLTAEQLCAMYRTQFAVLRKYEYRMWFDANGRKVPADVIRAWQADPDHADLGRYQPPFTQPDREKEMTRAYEEFQRRLDQGELG